MFVFVVVALKIQNNCTAATIIAAAATGAARCSEYANLYTHTHAHIDMSYVCLCRSACTFSIFIKTFMSIDQVNAVFKVSQPYDCAQV